MTFLKRDSVCYFIIFTPENDSLKPRAGSFN